MRHSRTVGRRVVVAVSCLTIGLPLASCGNADTDRNGEEGTESTESPLAGETIEFAVGYDPGGGYDTYARMLAPYLGDCLEAQVLVVNEPGAGGLISASKTATSDSAASRISISNTNGLAASQLAASEGLTFDVRDVSWIGRLSSPPNVVVVGAGSELQAFKDIINSSEDFRWASSGLGSNDYLNPLVLSGAYDLPSEIVTGFAGAPEARLSVIAGDTDAYVGPVDSLVKGVESGDTRAVVTIADKPHEMLPDVPAITSMPPSDPEGVALIESLINFSELGRGVFGPAGMDEERLQAFREGFMCAMENQDLLEEFSSQSRPLDVLDGDTMAALADEALAAPKDFQALVADSFSD
jgi:tripartite-type tricarboxylate transporter receptor subunit TctC